MKPLITCEHVDFGYENHDAVIDLNLEIYPGDYVESNGKKDRQYNRSDGHSMLKMVSCGTDRDVRGRLVKSQAWNASVIYGDAGSAGSITWTTTTTTVSIPTSTYFSAVVDSTVTSRKW